MRLCKEKIVAMVICIVFMLIAGTCFYSEYIRIKNIFDKMYYTRVRTHYDWWGGALGGGGNEPTSFSNMPQIVRISRDEESYYTDEGYFVNNYKGEYLGEGESLVIVCERNEKTMAIIAAKRFTEFKIIYRYTYDIKKRQLKEVVECRYGELYSGEANEYPESYKEYSDDLQEILLVIGDTGLTKEDLIQYKKYFLYDKLLTDWQAANDSRFSANRLGNVEFIEVLPLEANE